MDRDITPLTRACPPSLGIDRPRVVVGLCVGPPAWQREARAVYTVPRPDQSGWDITAMLPVPRADLSSRLPHGGPKKSHLKGPGHLEPGAQPAIIS